MQPKEIIVRKQSDLDKIKKDFAGTIFIEGGTEDKPLELTIAFEKAYIVSRGSAQLILHSVNLNEMRGSSQVRVMWGSSQVGVMRESSQVGVMWGSSQVGVMSGSSQVKLYGQSMVSAYSAKKIECHGYNIVRIMDGRKKDVNVIMNKESHLIIIPHIEMDGFKNYSKIYPVEIKGKKTILYKAVHKVNGEYLSDYSRNVKYIVGEIKEEKNDPSNDKSCSYGIHLSHFSGALSFGNYWDDMAILECETDIKDIVVSKDCNGKVRTSKIKVLRELTKDEYYKT